MPSRSGSPSPAGHGRGTDGAGTDGPNEGERGDHCPPSRGPVVHVDSSMVVVDRFGLDRRTGQRQAQPAGTAGDQSHQAVGRGDDDDQHEDADDRVEAGLGDPDAVDERKRRM